MCFPDVKGCAKGNLRAGWIWWFGCWESGACTAWYRDWVKLGESWEGQRALCAPEGLWKGQRALCAPGGLWEGSACS